MAATVVAVAAPMPLLVVAMTATVPMARLPVVSRVVPGRAGRASAGVFVPAVERSAGQRVARMPVLPALVRRAAMGMALALALAAVRIMPGVMSPPSAGLCQIVALEVPVAFASVMQPERDGFFV